MRILKSALKNEILLISFLYTLAYGIILFNNGLFFDDWCLYNAAKSTIVSMLKQLGILGYEYYMMFACFQRP